MSKYPDGMSKDEWERMKRIRGYSNPEEEIKELRKENKRLRELIETLEEMVRKFCDKGITNKEFKEKVKESEE